MNIGRWTQSLSKINWRRGFFRLTIVVSLIVGTAFGIYAIGDPIIGSNVNIAEYPIRKLGIAVVNFLVGFGVGVLSTWFYYGVLYGMLWILRMIGHWIIKGFHGEDKNN